MSRTSDLLHSAAEALEDGQDPLATPFLAEHGVTYDECMDLADLLAMGARLTAWALEHPDEALGAVTGAQVAGSYRRLNEHLARMSGEGQQRRPTTSDGSLSRG